MIDSTKKTWTMTAGGGISIAALLIFFVAAHLPRGAEGIWCFQCNSMIDPDCADIKTNQTSSIHYKECEVNEMGYEVFCRKIIQKIHDRDGMVRVVRKCGWKRDHRGDCYKTSSVGHADKVCQCFTDACNSAPKHFNIFILLLPFLLMLAVHFGQP